MDDVEYSVHISERDWDTFFQECEECNLLPPVLAGLEDSGMSDPDDFVSHRSHNKMSRLGKDTLPAQEDLTVGPPDCKGSPVESYLDRYGLRSPDSVLSGSEDDVHLESVNRFFEQLRNGAAPEQSQRNRTISGSLKPLHESTYGKKMDIEHDYPSFDSTPNGPLGVRKNQDTINSHDLKPKCIGENGTVTKPTENKVPTDWYTRSMELALTEEEMPMTAWKSYSWKESETRNVPHDNLAREKKLLPSGLGTPNPGPALSSDLAAHQNYSEAMKRGDDDMYHCQPVLRRNLEPREILPGASQSPLSSLRRKKRRRKRISMEPVDVGNSYEGQFFGDRSESDDGDRYARVRVPEMDRDARLTGNVGVVKTPDKSGGPSQLPPRSLIDVCSDLLPGQANSRTWIESFTGPREELSAAGKPDDGVRLSRAYPAATCHTETLRNEEQSGGCPAVSSVVCNEKPLLVGSSSKAVETPITANVSELMKTHMHLLCENLSPQEEVEGDKVTSNLADISTQPLETCKSGDQVLPETQESSAKSRPKSAAGLLEAQRRMSLRVSGLLGPSCGASLPPPPQPQPHIVRRHSDSRKILPPLDHSMPLAKSQSDTGQSMNAQDLTTLPDMLSDLMPKQSGKLNLVCPTCERQISCEEPNANTEVVTPCGGQMDKIVETLKSAEPVKIPNKPTNKDSSPVSSSVPQTMSPGVLGEIEAQTSLLDKQNKPDVQPAHLNYLTTAEQPAELGETATDKHMQIREGNAEMTDDRVDNTQSKHILAFPPDANPKDMTSKEETNPTEQNMPEITAHKRHRDVLADVEKNDSNVAANDETLYSLAKWDGKNGDIGAEGSSTNSLSSERNIVSKQAMECSDSVNNNSLESVSSLMKEPCKSVTLRTAQNREESIGNTDSVKDSDSCPTPVVEEDREDVKPENKDSDDVEQDQEPGPVFAISAFWNEMEKLTINDILRLRLVNQAQHPSLLAPLDNTSLDEPSNARDSGYFTHVDDTRPDRSSGDVSTMSDFDEDPAPLADQEVLKPDADMDLVNANDVSWVNDPDLVLASAEADDMLVLSTDNAIPHSRYAEQQYFRKMYKNISVQNLRALENQPFRQILRNVSVQSLRSLDDDEASDPFYHINTSTQFSDDESVDGHGFSLSEIIEFLFCDSDDSKAYDSDAESLTSHVGGASVAESYDHFFSEFETANLLFPKPDGSAGSDSKDILPIFSCTRSTDSNLQFPELYDYLFPDSPVQSDGEEEKEHSPPIRVVSRYLQREPVAQTTGDPKGNPFWTSPLSLRRVRRSGLVLPTPSQLSLLPLDGGKKSALKTIQPITAMGYEHQIAFPDPLLCDLESRIFRKLAEQKMRCPELQTAVADPRIDAPLVPLKQSDMCLVCIAFASWVLKSAGSQGADTWKAVLLANISALSAIRYLRRYVKDEANAAKPLRQIEP